MSTTMTLDTSNYLEKLIDIQKLLQQYSCLELTIKIGNSEVSGYQDDLLAYNNAMKNFANKKTISLSQLQEELGYIR